MTRRTFPIRRVLRDRHSLNEDIIVSYFRNWVVLDCNLVPLYEFQCQLQSAFINIADTNTHFFYDHGLHRCGDCGGHICTVMTMRNCQSFSERTSLRLGHGAAQAIYTSFDLLDALRCVHGVKGWSAGCGSLYLVDKQLYSHEPILRIRFHILCAICDILRLQSIRCLSLGLLLT